MAPVSEVLESIPIPELVDYIVRSGTDAYPAWSCLSHLFLVYNSFEIDKQSNSPFNMNRLIGYSRVCQL